MVTGKYCRTLVVTGHLYNVLAAGPSVAWIWRPKTVSLAHLSFTCRVYSSVFLQYLVQSPPCTVVMCNVFCTVGAAYSTLFFTWSILTEAAGRLTSRQSVSRVLDGGRTIPFHCRRSGNVCGPWATYFRTPSVHFHVSSRRLVWMPLAVFTGGGAKGGVCWICGRCSRIGINHTRPSESILNYWLVNREVKVSCIKK